MVNKDEEAYKSINWSVVFLIALLIPIGIAMNEAKADVYIGKFIINMSQRRQKMIVIC